MWFSIHCILPFAIVFPVVLLCWVNCCSSKSKDTTAVAVNTIWTYHVLRATIQVLFHKATLSSTYQFHMRHIWRFLYINFFLWYEVGGLTPNTYLEDRGIHFFWVITFDLSGMGDHDSNHATSSTDLRICSYNTKFKIYQNLWSSGSWGLGGACSDRATINEQNRLWRQFQNFVWKTKCDTTYRLAYSWHITCNTSPAVKQLILHDVCDVKDSISIKM
jgi:hypothetical protein